MNLGMKKNPKFIKLYDKMTKFEFKIGMNSLKGIVTPLHGVMQI